MRTFDPTLPTKRDEIRSRLRDVDTAKAVLLDEEIDAWLLEYGFQEAFAVAAEALATHWSLQVADYQEGARGLRAQWAQRVEHYQKLADDARAGVLPNIEAPRTGASVGMAIAPDTRNMRTD